MTCDFALANAAARWRRDDLHMARLSRLVRLVLDVLVLRGRCDRSMDVGILVRRHQLGVLQRQVPRPPFEPDDRALLSALARAVGRDRWSNVIVTPATRVRWRRRLVAKRWTCSHRPGGCPPPSNREPTPRRTTAARVRRALHTHPPAPRAPTPAQPNAVSATSTRPRRHQRHLTPTHRPDRPARSRFRHPHG
jgi:hypothetical protein